MVRGFSPDPRCLQCGKPERGLYCEDCRVPVEGEKPKRKKKSERAPAVEHAPVELGLFVFPLPPAIANKRWHWSERNRKREEYIAACDNAQLLGKVPGPPKNVPRRIRLAAHLFIGGRYNDDDNAMARMKWLVDWLVTRGYVEEDRPENIEWAELPIPQTIEPANRRVEVRVWVIAS